MIYNQPLGDYTVSVRLKEGSKFHSYCGSFTLAYNNTKSDFNFTAPLARKVSGKTVVVLEHRSFQGEMKSLGATLGVRVPFDQNDECIVSMFNRKCKGFTFSMSDAA